MSEGPPVQLTDKTRELLRLLAGDRAMRLALRCFPGDPVKALLEVSRMEERTYNFFRKVSDVPPRGCSDREREGTTQEPGEGTTGSGGPNPALDLRRGNGSCRGC